MKLLTLTGPSCSGKTTLQNNLVENHGFKGLVSHTTRPPRKGEADGKDYFFVSDDQFEELKQQGALMEHVEFNGYKYGLSVTEVANATVEGKTPVVIVEPQGLIQITKYAQENGIELVKFYIGGDLRTLIQRYLMRSADEDMSNGETAERHAKRIASIFTEHNEWRWKTYSDGYSDVSLYDHTILGYNAHTERKYIQFIKSRI
jgi:guanylate kinase